MEHLQTLCNMMIIDYNEVQYDLCVCFEIVIIVGVDFDILRCE